MKDITELLENETKRYILGKLMTNESLKYSQLMPQNIDNVLFNYHLQHLVKHGIILKNENIYSLSNFGKEKVTNLMAYNGEKFQSFDNRYLLYLIYDGKILYHLRNREPWIGDTTVISGRVRKGVGTIQRANSRFKEKTGLECDFQWIGTLRKIIQNKNGELLNDLYYQVCVAKEFLGNLIEVSPFTEDKHFWLTFDEAFNYEKSNKSAGDKTIEVLERFKSNNFAPFCFEEILVREEL